MTRFQAPRGASDILPPRSVLHETIVRTGEDLFKIFGYQRIETPIFEQTEVFERGLAAESEIVTKQMYTFQDKGGGSLTLRPDGTAPVVRAAIQHDLSSTGMAKLYYSGPMFRHERPQAGRGRQFTQIGVEAIGSASPDIDAEVVVLAAKVFEAVRLEGLTLLLNSIGHPGCRSVYIPVLVDFLEANRENLSADSRRRITINPLRTFDSKNAGDKKVLAQAPLISDYLCGSCADHFDTLQALLSELGVTFTLEPRLVRGLDYYTRTTFEFTAPGLGAQNTVGAGGRYDGLAELLGGGALPGIGFALGVDRIALALEAATEDEELRGLDVFVAAASDAARKAALLVATRLRERGVSADLDFMGRSLRSQLTQANRAKARWAVVIGDRELAEGNVTLRNMTTGEETSIPEKDLAERLSSHG
jgi:histidyl-tRNA synthetase